MTDLMGSTLLFSAAWAFMQKVQASQGRDGVDAAPAFPPLSEEDSMLNALAERSETI